MKDKAASSPRILQWYSGGLGVVWDEGLNLHSRRKLMDWVQHGQRFIILDYETGEDVTRVFLAQEIDSPSPLIDPME
jgi:hypothetical protein